MFLAIPIFLEFVNDFYPYFVFFLPSFSRPIPSLLSITKKTPGLFTGSSKNYEFNITKCMFLQRAGP